ncbi:MAG: hypothetical protein II646_00155 [Firmicutes bacterium]|nr:hypothetical protein [Bacillota bacterium]
MSKKLLPILFIIVLLASFFLMWNYTHQDVPPAADPVPVEDPVAETVPEPASETDPEPVEGTDEIAWNYDEFPEDYTFRSKKYLDQHYEKHGIDMGFENAQLYEESANLVIHHPDVLHKIEKEDGDTCFYLEETNEFVVLSKDGYIRTYFWPDSGKKYYDKQ